MGEGELVRRVEVEREDRLQIRQVVGVRGFAQHEQAIDVAVHQRLGRRVMLEQGQAVFAVFGFDGLAGELDARALQQQQRAAQVGDGIAQLGILDAVQRLFELCGFLFEGRLLLLFFGGAAAGHQQRRAQAESGQRGSHIHHLSFPVRHHRAE